MKISWRVLAVRVWNESMKDDVFGLAAQIAYYTLLAIFPLLLLLTTLLGFMAQTGSEVYENLLSYARQMLPYEAFTLVFTTLKQIQAGAGGFKLGFSLLATLWASSSGTSAMIQGLNRAYETKETRPWWKTSLIAIALTILLSVFVIVALTLVLYGNKIGGFIAAYFGLETIFTAVWNVVNWPLALLFLLIALILLYRYAPNTKPCSWRRIFPGALVGMLLWLSVSLLFRLYLQFFNSYNRTYGSLGAVIILLLWFYLSEAAILIGAEVNSELDKANPIPTSYPV